MSINELPDASLLIIFGLINELDDLVNCYKVCRKWSHLIAERTRTVKYLIGHRVYVFHRVKIPRNIFGYVYYNTKAPIDGTCLSTLFPNLIIADFSEFLEKVKYDDMARFVNEIKPLKGLMHIYYRRGESIFQYCDQLEMVSTDYIDPCMEKIGVNIKQLRLDDVTLAEFKKDAHFFPNLERMYIYDDGDFATMNGYYDGPMFERLKIVELYLLNYGTDTYYGFQFMDLCPNLQSAHLLFNTNRIYVDESVKNKSLQDLVLKFDGYHSRVDWNDLKRVLMKYPNLKHLLLSNFNILTDEYVVELVRILPNLVLLNVRGEHRSGVSRKVFDYVRDYCKLHGRSINFYLDEDHLIQSDWPQLSTNFEKISQGFDFMKNCFLKDFMVLPNFLISNED